MYAFVRYLIAPPWTPYDEAPNTAPSRRTSINTDIVGPQAGELIAEATSALEMGATLTDLAFTVHAHPTLPRASWRRREFTSGPSTS
jgi:hypothetical protein